MTFRVNFFQPKDRLSRVVHEVVLASVILCRHSEENLIVIGKCHAVGFD